MLVAEGPQAEADRARQQEEMAALQKKAESANVEAVAALQQQVECANADRARQQEGMAALQKRADSANIDVVEALLQHGSFAATGRMCKH